MNFLNKWERKFGRYAITNLTAIIIGLYAAGYLLSVAAPNILNYLTLEPYYILRGQVWRLVTWLIVPPSSLDIFTIIMLFFYFSIGRALEQTWGAFRYNVYILSGMLFTALGAFLLYGIFAAQGHYYTFGALFTTYYINMSIFLAFAATYPEHQVLLYFIIPIKMKWMGFLYGFLLIVSFAQNNWAGRVAIIASLMNFIIFFLTGDGMKRRGRRMNPREVRRRQEFRREVKKATPQSGATIHKCAVCGRTEKDGADLVFRYCSQCRGNYEYCQEHLFSHEHR